MKSISIPTEQLKQPLYVTASERIKEMARAGAFPGGCLPGEHELAQALAVSRGTLRQALGVLREAGVVYNRRGKGSFLREAGRGPTGAEKAKTGLLQFATVPIQEQKLEAEFMPATQTMLERFERSSGLLLAQLHHTCLYDGEVIAYRLAFLPYETLDKNGVAPDDPQGLIALLEQVAASGTAGSTLRFNCVDAMPAVAQYMGVATGAPLLYIAEQVRTDSGEVAMYAKAYFQPAYFDFFINRG